MNRFLLLCCSLFPSVLLLPAQPPAEHLFYAVDSEESFRSLKRNIEKISIVAPGLYSVDEDGIVWGSVDPRILDLAARHTVGVMPLIVNPGFDQQMLHRLLVNPEARARAIASFLDECARHRYIGMQFDFENLHQNDKNAFTTFFKETAEAFHRRGLRLSVAVVHRPEEFAGSTTYHKWLFENWRAGYDLKELAAAGDFISVMTYSQHTRRTTPGPSAGMPWTKQVVEYFLQFVPPEKLSLGIPTGGMHWYTALDTTRYVANARSWSNTISYETALGIIERHRARLLWNDEQQVQYAVFANAGLFEYIYLDDARSFKAKFDLVRTLKLRGFSVWVLGTEDPATWNGLPKVSR